MNRTIDIEEVDSPYKEALDIMESLTRSKVKFKLSKHTKTKPSILKCLWKFYETTRGFIAGQFVGPLLVRKAQT